jgi:hypothetical protein
MSSDTTNIFDLPTDPLGGGNINNISMSSSENVVIQPNLQVGNTNGNTNGNSMSLDQSTISQIVNELQQASISKATQLPSRDIPMMTASHSNDAQVQPNFIPVTPNHCDYIQNDENNEDIIDSYNRNVNNSSLDDIYNEIQTPLLLAVLFFLFQLPFFKKNLFNYFPFLFSKDGNLNMNGFIFTSVVFSFSYYLLNKTTIQFSKF